MIEIVDPTIRRRFLAARIEGLPPKKDGANSMWNKPLEVERLIALRTIMRGILGGTSPLLRDIKLTARIHVNPIVAESCGDLDNFVTGICDGLMAAHPRAKLSSLWQEAEYSDIHPTIVIGLKNDGAIFTISASKICDSESPWYEIELEGE